MLTNKQQKIENRREIVADAYNKLQGNVSPLVTQLAARFNCTSVTIYADIAHLKSNGIIKEKQNTTSQ